MPVTLPQWGGGVNPRPVRHLLGFGASGVWVLFPLQVREVAALVYLLLGAARGEAMTGPTRHTLLSRTPLPLPVLPISLFRSQSLPAPPQSTKCM